MFQKFAAMVIMVVALTGITTPAQAATIDTVCLISTRAVIEQDVQNDILVQRKVYRNKKKCTVYRGMRVVNRYTVIRVRLGAWKPVVFS